jgi:hypothetical protein
MPTSNPPNKKPGTEWSHRDLVTVPGLPKPPTGRPQHSPELVQKQADKMRKLANTTATGKTPAQRQKIKEARDWYMKTTVKQKVIKRQKRDDVYNPPGKKKPAKKGK